MMSLTLAMYIIFTLFTRHPSRGCSFHIVLRSTVFSVYRRQGDIQQRVESYGSQRNRFLVVIKNGVALCPSVNLRDRSALCLWTSIIRCGPVAALIGAPPCETWTRVRWRELLMLIKDIYPKEVHMSGRCVPIATQEIREGRLGTYKPKPLRSAAEPGGRSGRTVRERLRLEFGNGLRFAMIERFVVAAMMGSAAIIEHPAFAS